MKTTQDFIKSLGLGTLKNLTGSIVDTEHNILDKAIPELIHWTNEGLNTLHTILEIPDSLTVHIYESRVTYPLRSEYNMTEEEYFSDEPIYERFIWKGRKEDGSVDYFNDNLMQIISVSTHEGLKLPLNDYSNVFSAYTPEFDVLQIPTNMPSGVVEVLYRAKHPEVSYEDNTIIRLPPTLYDALANYIAYKIHSTMNGTNAVENANKYYNEYNNIVENAIRTGVINHNDYQPDFGKFYKRGFV